MGQLGWFLVASGLVVAAASAYPFVYVIATSSDPTINPASQGVLMVCGGFAGLMAAAWGGSMVFKDRTGKWPVGF